MSAPTPTIELQADIIGSYVLGSILDAQYSNSSPDKKASQIYQESGGARMVVTELGDAFFNDADHHGTSASRMNAIDQGFSAGLANKYGPLSRALTAKEDELYDWSFKTADDIFKHQNMHVDRTFLR
jgi:predicted metalloprotease